MRKLISLYTGAGGLDLGFEAAGFETAVAVEFDAEAAATLRHNRPWPVIDRDIHTVSSKELLNSADLKPGEPDALIGGPPCQPFSKSGYWVSGDTLRLEDSRAGTLGAYLRVLRDSLPKTFLLENVPGLVYQNKSEGLHLIERAIEQINQACRTRYTITVNKINAADFGVPQIRERVFVVGSRDGNEFHFPTPTHAPEEEVNPLVTRQKPYTTAWDAIGDLDEKAWPTELNPAGKWAALLTSIPEGQNYLWHTPQGGGEPLFGWRTRYWSFLLKLSKRRPSWTIQAAPGPATGPFHWRNRLLSIEELARLQTFPRDYNFIGSRRSVHRQIGNAVPCALGELLGLEIRRQLLGDTVPQRRLTLIPTRRRDCPPAHRHQAVPNEYLHLRGAYPPHPGTGLGPRRAWIELTTSLSQEN